MQTDTPLSPKARRALRAAAHDLKVVVTVGDKGVTPALLAELDGALQTHELLKVRVNAEDRAARDTLIEALTAGSGAELVGRTGFVATLWRERREEAPRKKPGVERGRKREQRKRDALAKGPTASRTGRGGRGR